MEVTPHEETQDAGGTIWGITMKKFFATFYQVHFQNLQKYRKNRLEKSDPQDYTGASQMEIKHCKSMNDEENRGKEAISKWR